MRQTALHKRQVVLASADRWASATDRSSAARLSGPHRHGKPTTQTTSQAMTKSRPGGQTNSPRQTGRSTGQATSRRHHGQRAGLHARRCKRVPTPTNGRTAMIILGIILLVIGAIMWLLGSVGGGRYRVAGRRHWF